MKPYSSLLRSVRNCRPFIPPSRTVFLRSFYSTAPPGQPTTSTPTPTSQTEPTQPTMSTSQDPPQQSQSPSQNPLSLPSPSSASDATTLTVDGQAVKLDHLGPMVVNTDGTLSRIANWETMAEVERQNTLRIIGKRNKARLEKLRENEGVAGGS